MIVVDTSALMAILQGEPEAGRCSAIITREERLLMSSATVAEALIVSAGRNIDDEMNTLIEALAVEIVPVTAATARRVAGIYRRWGKGFHPAGLNFGDCFAYDLAKDQDCPLLFAGQDFSRTDLRTPD
jgi:ribonuclease VapC